MVEHQFGFDCVCCPEHCDVEDADLACVSFLVSNNQHLACVDVVVLLHSKASFDAIKLPNVDQLAVAVEEQDSLPLDNCNCSRLVDEDLRLVVESFSVLQHLLAAQVCKVDEPLVEKCLEDEDVSLVKGNNKAVLVAAANRGNLGCVEARAANLFDLEFFIPAFVAAMDDPV